MDILLFALLAIVIFSPLLPAPPRRPPQIAANESPADPAFRVRLSKVAGAHPPEPEL